jgi:hypothetical protein
MVRQVAAGDLQHEISPKEDARDCASLLRIQVKVPANVRQSERDVHTIDERDRVHDKRDGNDAYPAP